MKSLFVTIGVIALLTTNAFASRDSIGNGAVSVVCYNPQGSIESAQLLDTFEAELPPHYLAFPKDIVGVDQRLLNVYQKTAVNKRFSRQFQEEMAKVKAKILQMPSDVGIEPTDDAFPIVNKKGCVFKQLANYADDGYIYRDEEIFAALDEVNQAGFFVHETVYAIARANAGDKSSKRSRQLTALLLAENADPALIAQLMTELTNKSSAQPTPRPRRDSLKAGIYYDPSGKFCPVKARMEVIYDEFWKKMNAVTLSHHKDSWEELNTDCIKIWFKPQRCTGNRKRLCTKETWVNTFTTKGSKKMLFVEKLQVIGHTRFQYKMISPYDLHSKRVRETIYTSTFVRMDDEE